MVLVVMMVDVICGHNNNRDNSSAMLIIIITIAGFTVCQLHCYIDSCETDRCSFD